MASNRQKILGPKVRITPPPSAASQLTSLNNKFARLKEIREGIVKLRGLYKEHDELMEELLPLFISVTTNEITILREVSFGAHKYRFNPHFYDIKKGKVLAKVWKSTAFESGTIE